MNILYLLVNQVLQESIHKLICGLAPIVTPKKPEGKKLPRGQQRIFSGLNTEKPMVKTITEIFRGEGEPASSESHGQVLSRSRDSAEIVLLWGHTQKCELAIIDLSLKKAAIGYVFRGATSIGGRLQTLDCH